MSSLEDGVHVLALFAKLNAVNRVKAIERIETLFSIQDGKL